MPKVTDQTRQSVFEDFTDAEWLSRYYGSQADAYRTRHHLTRLALLASVLVEALIVVPLVSSWDPYGLYVIAVVSLVVIGLTVYDAISNHSGQVAKLTVACDEFHVLKSEWRSLYLGIETDRLDEQQVLERQRELINRANRMNTFVEVNQDDKRNQTASKEADKVMSEQYG